MARACVVVFWGGRVGWVWLRPRCDETVVAAAAAAHDGVTLRWSDFEAALGEVRSRYGVSY